MLEQLMQYDQLAGRGLRVPFRSGCESESEVPTPNERRGRGDSRRRIRKNFLEIYIEHLS